MEFEAYPKTPRFYSDVVVTEKLDGTNSQIAISAFDEEAHCDPNVLAAAQDMLTGVVYAMRAGSRSRWVTPGKDTDNFGFAAWVLENAQELFKLGEGRHFGEWWGKGIQRGYDMDHKRFSLFNVKRWGDNPDRPSCAHVVPVLYSGDISGVDVAISSLNFVGSLATPTIYRKPEGAIVYHAAANRCFKILIDKGSKG